MNSIKVGNIYKMSGIDVICIGFTKKGHAKMQTLGMTHGGWPGEGDIKNYDDITRDFTSEWAGIIKKLRLSTLKDTRKNEKIRTALIKSAENYSSFRASSCGSWLGTSSDLSDAWIISSHGNYNYGNHTFNYVIAPRFNLNVSKIILDGNEIKRCKMETSIKISEEAYTYIAETLKKEMLKYGFRSQDMTVTEFVEDILSTIIETAKAESGVKE